MCGRYAVGRRSEDLIEQFAVDDPPRVGTPPDHNVAPGKAAPVVLERPRTDGQGHTRLLRPLVWGLVPSWAENRATGRRMINARSETFLERPAFRRAALLRRCLIPADGWYEWQPRPAAPGLRRREPGRPFFIHPADPGPIALAGIHEQWRGPNPSPGGTDDGPLSTFAILTTDSEPDLRPIHDRRPVVLPPALWDAWLDPDLRDSHRVGELLQDLPPGRFLAEPVSTRVNSPAENGPDLVLPVPDRDLPARPVPEGPEKLF
ncbi:MAG: hypothetical protein QG608_180 [Actinomycetota bacterium]|nr:hypothetical protein [Actinomycetota bacterium]